jgi:hypothetical protein
MRFVAVETGQAMSAPQPPTTTRHYFLEMTSPQCPTFYVTAHVVSWFPYLFGLVDGVAPSNYRHALVAVGDFRQIMMQGHLHHILDKHLASRCRNKFHG